MPGRAPKNRTQKACLEGVQTAAKNYYRWSGGYCIIWAPESYIQAEIARALAKVWPYVTIEDSVREVLREACACLKGPLPRSKTGRVDLTAWGADGRPRVLIEVKKTGRFSRLNADARRLRQMLSRGGTHRHGLVVVITSAGKPETIDTRFEAMAQSSGAELACRLGAQEWIGDDDVWWYWDCGCFVVKGVSRQASGPS